MDSKENFSQLRIAFPPGCVDDVKLGASVAINGTCLTVTKVCSKTTTSSEAVVWRSLVKKHLYLMCKAPALLAH